MINKFKNHYFNRIHMAINEGKVTELFINGLLMDSDDEMTYRDGEYSIRELNYIERVIIRFAKAKKYRTIYD